jgi:hypothetical protein
MIEINLLPEELRIKAKVKAPAQQVTVKSNAGFNQDLLFIYAIPALLGVFVLAHLYFAVLAISKNGKLASLNRQWIALEPQKKASDEFNKEFSASSQDAGMTAALVNQRVLWAQKLNKLSLHLPPGVWFTDITINSKDVIIRGSVISLVKEEVSLINKLLDNLKDDIVFTKDFSGFELSSVDKRAVGGYDIADFILTGTLKTK